MLLKLQRIFFLFVFRIWSTRFLSFISHPIKDVSQTLILMLISQTWLKRLLLSLFLVTMKHKGNLMNTVQIYFKYFIYFKAFCVQMGRSQKYYFNVILMHLYFFVSGLLSTALSLSSFCRFWTRHGVVLLIWVRREHTLMCRHNKDIAYVWHHFNNFQPARPVLSVLAKPCYQLDTVKTDIRFSHNRLSNLLAILSPLNTILAGRIR